MKPRYYPCVVGHQKLTARCSQLLLIDLLHHKIKQNRMRHSFTVTKQFKTNTHIPLEYSPNGKHCDPKGDEAPNGLLLNLKLDWVNAEVGEELKGCVLLNEPKPIVLEAPKAWLLEVLMVELDEPKAGVFEAPNDPP